MKAEGKAGNLHPRDISADLGAAAQRIAVALRDKPAKTPAAAVYNGLASQPDAFENPMVTELMQFLIANRANRVRMEEVISNYVEGVAQLGNPAQVDMFGGEPATREQLWQKAVDPATTETRENRHALATAALSDREITVSDLEEDGLPVANLEEASVLLSRGYRLFAMHEMDEGDEGLQELINEEDMEGYTSDQIMALPPDAPLSSAVLQRPSFIKELAEVSGDATLTGDGNTPTTNQSGSPTGPQRTFADSSGLDQGSISGGKPEDGAERRLTNRSADRGTVRAPGMGTLSGIAPDSLAEGLSAIALKDSFKGQEHEVYYDRASGKVVKLTLPGEVGARGSLPGYLRQMQEMSDVFNDGVEVEGWVQFPGEKGPRVVSTQPWVEGEESTLPDIELYMRRKGFLRVFDGAWWNPSTELQVTDALPKNFRTDKNRRVHPIDLILSWPSLRAQERIEDMVNAQPQPDPTPEPPLSSAVLPSQIGPDNLEAFAGVVDKRILATIKMLDVTLEFDAEWQLPKLPEPTGPKPPATARQVDGVFVLTHATAVIQPTMIKDDDGEVIPNYLLDYMDPGKEYTREELHSAIVMLYVDRAKKARAEGRGKVLFTGGGPAAGKSTFIREMQSTGEIATGDGILTLTADDIKMLIPEMQEMLAREDSRAAGTVHVESQKIFNDVVAEVLALPYHVNLIWDATLSHAPQVIPLMEQIKGLGYEMHLRGIVIDPWEAMNRSVDRGLKSKRLVPAGGTLWGHKGFHMNFREYLPLVDSYEVRGIMFGDNVYEDGGQGLRSIVVESSVSPVAKDRGEQYYFTQERSNLNEYATSKNQLLASYDYGHPAFEERGPGNNSADEGARGNEDQGYVPDNGRRAALRPAAPAGPLSSADLFGEWADSLPAKTKRSKPAFAQALKAEVPAGKLPTVGAISDLFDFASSGGYGVNHGTQGNGSGSDGRPGNTGAAVGTPAGGKNSKRSKNAPGGANDLFDWSAEFQTGGTTAGSGQPGGSGPDGRGTGSGGNSDGVAKPPERGAAKKPVGGLREDSPGRDGLHPIVPQPENPADRNHVIDPLGKVAPRTNSQKWAGNFAAMKLLRQLDEDGRNPTPEEKSTLEAYTGWGWMKEAFNDVRAKAYAELKSTWEATIARELERPPYRPSYDRSPARSTNWEQRARENDPEKAQTLLSWQATYGEHYDRLRAELTDKEFRSAAKSVRNAHFTTPSVIGSMWKAVERLGFKGGRAMEPGGGIGHFIGVQPPSMAERTRWEATELDDVTARILSKLYPQARVNGKMPAPGREVSGMGFQDSRIPNNSLDLLISNVPFAKEGPGKAKSEFGQDFNLHNYFFARALAKVKPGGLVVFITSSGTMESQRAQRAYLNGKAELVASWRLPNDAFAENAGTEVVTDVIMLRKPDGKSVVKPEPWMEKMQVGRDNVMSRRPVDKTRPWQKTTVDLHTWFSDIQPDWDPTSVEMATAWRPWMDGGRPKTGKKWDAVVKAFRERPESSDSLEFSAPIRVNEYYARHPENVLGRHALQGSMYSAGEYTVQSMGSLDEQLAAAVERLPENVLGDSATTGWDAVAAERDDKIDSYVERDGTVYQVTAEGLEPVEWNDNETLDKAKRTAAKKKLAIFRQWAKLRDAAVEMVNLEVNPASLDTDLDAARARLNTAYNAVMAYFGALGVRRNNKYRFLEDDPQYALLEALEEESMVTNEKGEVSYRYKKADIFRQRIIPVLEAPTTAATPLRMIC